MWVVMLNSVFINKKTRNGGNMYRKLMLIVASTLVIVMTVSMAFALGGGNGRKGKFLYRKNCRTCHNGADAKDLSPADMTQAEWTAKFSDMSKIKCAGDWTIDKKAVNDIFTYLHDYAKDSPSPAKCN